MHTMLVLIVINIIICKYMETVVSFKTQCENLDVEYEVNSTISQSVLSDRDKIINSIADLDERLMSSQANLDQLNIDIDELTNKADGFDYTIAVCSGMLCGFIDSFYVGEFNFVDLKTDANKHVNKFVEKYAKLNGWRGEGRLDGAIKYLENIFPVAQDNIWKPTGVSSTRLHHLEDLAHHPTPCGLFFAIIVAFFSCGVFVDKEGRWQLKIVDIKPKDIAKLWILILLSGILRWLVYVAESKYLEEKETKLPAPLRKLLKLVAYTPGIISILTVSANWLGHLVSDMAGSKNTAGGGMGIPGLFLSLLKELSSLPYLKNTSLPQLVSIWYSKDKFDLRSELAIEEYAGKQSVPVIINECIVRCFYFVRHLIAEKQQCDWKDVNWHNIVPWGNRTVNRMLTIATGTFMTFDVADAAVRSAIKNGANIYNPKLYADFVLRVNFVGIGRFAIAIGTDIYMGYKKSRLEKERLYLLSEQLMLTDAKIFYKQADTWIYAKDTTEAIGEMEKAAIASVQYMKDYLHDIEQCMENIDSSLGSIGENNPGDLGDLQDIIKYGN